ncbi:UNVERIFIED_CONTAM: hypothetical protein GTU68_044085 [Idotea baltica]|nr:hypothetical protein [Idotea baltica]
MKEMQNYRSKVENVLNLSYRESLARGIFFGLTGLSGNIIILSVLYYGGTLVTESALSVGQLSSFLLYAAYVGIAFGGLSSFYSDLNKGLGASTRLFQLLDRVPSIPIAQGVSLASDSVRGSLRLEDVSFAYPTRPDRRIFEHFSLHVPAGSVVALVGSSGSGKSTIASLLLRLYDPQEGRITIDDTPLCDIDPASLRSVIASVSQEPSLFSSTILENIVYGCRNPDSVSMEDVVRAATEANAISFISGFPDQFETVVGERGVMLSGGQKQRIAIARAIISNPKILLLDEATSALDSESESLVQEALERLMKNKTVITIAHRLSTIRNADQIAVLHEGSIAELGPYAELMRRPDGLFRKLVERQTITS